MTRTRFRDHELSRFVTGDALAYLGEMVIVRVDELAPIETFVRGDGLARGAHGPTTHQDRVVEVTLGNDTGPIVEVKLRFEL